MKLSTNFKQRIKNNRGATIIIVALCLTLFIGFMALAIDMGYMMAARNEAQNAADAAALSGARRMGENYHVTLDPNDNVVTVAQDTAGNNMVAKLNLATGNVDVKIGTWGPPFTETSVFPNAVQVSVKREGGDGVGTFFARVWAKDKVNIGATGCAAISGTCNADLGLPLGIGKSWFTHTGANKGCTQIAVNKTAESCAGWTNFKSKFKQKDVQDMLKNPTTIPTVKVGDTVDFGGGTIDPIIDDLKALFDQKKGDDGEWTTSVVVYDDDNTCKNPVAPYQILGFATITVTGVVTTGNNKGLQGYVDCNIANEERGGCFYAGTYGSIPGLVK
jgi:hypothetical protein